MAIMPQTGWMVHVRVLHGPKFYGTTMPDKISAGPARFPFHIFGPARPVNERGRPRPGSHYSPTKLKAWVHVKNKIILKNFRVFRL